MIASFQWNLAQSDLDERGRIHDFDDEQREKWVASITYNSKKIYLGRYDAKEDAVMARLTKEIELYREFAPQKALLETLSLCSNGTLA